MDSASFRLAARVAQLLPGVLLVLTSRSAESGALGQVQLAAAHNAHAIELQPLDGQAALALAGQLLGGRAASAELQRHIREHSQGNPLYIVEYLLLEEHAADGAAPGASAQSMRSLITSHLDRLRPEEARAVRIASVLGTSFNWAQLQLLAEREPNGHETLQPWGLVRQRILTQQEGSERGFRFAHALLRDVAYELMLVQERKALHHDAARLLEELAEPTAASTLAHHWHLAGNAQRTQLWSDRAGSEALELGAFEEAAGHFERCLQLAEPHAEPRALTWHRKLGDAYAGLGALKTRAEHARVGLKLAGESVGPARSTSMARAGRDFLLHSLNLGGRPHTDSNIEVAALYRHLAHVAYFESDGPGLFVLTLRAVRAAENEATSAILCGALAELGGALGLGGMHPFGMRYLQRAVDTAQGLTHPHGLAYVHMVRALYLLGRGEWQQSQHSSEVCQDICERISDPVNWGNAQIIRFWSSYYRGDSAASESLAAGLFSRARRTGNRQHEVWALRALGLVRLRAGAPATARPQLESALSFAHIEDINEYMPTLAALALCHQRLGETERARELCEQALQLARKLGRPTGHAVLPGLAALVELALALFDPAQQGGAQGGAEVRAALARLDDYRRVFPIGVPTHHSCRAAVFERRGNGNAARRERERAARAALDLGMTAVMAFDATLPA
jgi:tetratricopeptide (TPR) repeat protein